MRMSVAVTETRNVGVFVKDNKEKQKPLLVDKIMKSSKTMVGGFDAKEKPL